MEAVVYEHRGVVVEERRRLHMRIYQNLTNQLNFGEKRSLRSSFIVSRSSINGFGKKEGGKITNKKQSLADILTVIFQISVVMTVMDSIFSLFLYYMTVKTVRLKIK